MVPLRRIRHVAVLAIMVAGVSTQMTPASAAALPRASGHARPAAAAVSHALAGSTATRSGRSRSHQAAVIRPRIKSAHGFGLTRRPDVRHAGRGQAAGSAAATRAGRAAAVRAALAGTNVSDTCSGVIQPDTVYPCTTPSGSGTDTFTLSLTSAADLLLFRALDTAGDALTITLTAPDSSTANCQLSGNDLIWQCPASQAGTYTLQVQNGGGSYTLAYRPLLSDPACTAANPSFTSPVLTAPLAAGGVGACYTLAMTAGQILHVNSTALNQGLLLTVFDSTGAQICFDDQGDCPLGGTGPYFVQVDAVQANAVTYHLELNNINQPQGCLPGPQLTYGSAPGTKSVNRCRTLTVATAGQYQVYAVSPQDGIPPSTLYTPDGTVACTNTYSSTAPPCQLAAGTYELVADPYPASRAQVGAVFIAADESRGCQATGDSDFASGPATGTFTGVGEEICLTLPASAGPTVYLFNQPTADATSPQLEVVDATGAQTCQSSDFVFTTCALTGTAPFRIILSGEPAGGGYRVLAQASGSTTGCKVWPQSGFGGSFGATVKLAGATDAACLSIPAGQHSTGEMIDYSNLANTVDAAIYVNDPAGNNVCIGASTAICSYTPGVTYTALLVSSTGQTDTYHLVRRDVSSTASCAAPASTVVGGPSTTVELTSALDTQCLRVTAAATDKLSFDIRATAPNSAGAVLQVTDAGGAVVCGQFEVICRATGSTSYQLLVTALGYQGIAITAHVDAWRVGTASGWMPQCRAHQLSGATGWAPIRAKMSEAAVGYCAVLSVSANQETTIYSPSFTGTGVGQPTMLVESAAGWSSDQILCDIGGPYVACDLPISTPPGKYALLVYPAQLPLPTAISFQGVCTLGCPGGLVHPVITSVQPAAGPAGSVNKLTVGGTNLNLGVVADLASNGNVVAQATSVSLNSGGTALTVLLNTQGVTPGTYDVVQDGVGYTVGVPSPGYLPGAYQVTAGPPAPAVGSFVPDGPARILDTSTGLGGPKGPIPPGGVAVLKVAGVAGVPATGTSAVLVSVTAEQPSKPGTVTAYPDGTVRPNVTDLSFNRAQASSDQVVVPVLDGKIDLYNGSAGSTGLVVVLSGYFTETGTHGLLKAVGPNRILDTRTGLGAPKAQLGAGKTLKLTVDGAGGVPATGVNAVDLSVIVRSPSRTGALTAFADGASRPAASQLAFVAGQTTAGLISVPVVNGSVDLYNGSSGPVDLTADVTGYFSAKGAKFQAVGPARALDTRTGLGGAGVSVLAHSAADLGLGALPGWEGTQRQVVLSVTVLDAGASGSLSVFPDGSAVPVDPNLIFHAGKPVTVQMIIPLTGPTIDFYNNSDGTIQILADVQGYGVPS